MYLCVCVCLLLLQVDWTDVQRQMKLHGFMRSAEDCRIQWVGKIACHFLLFLFNTIALSIKWREVYSNHVSCTYLSFLCVRMCVCLRVCLFVRSSVFLFAQRFE